MAVRRGLARLDHHLAEQDDQEQAEALGEVVRVERLEASSGRSADRSWSRRSRRAAVRSSASIALDSTPIATAHSA
jgi:hypothetical protein